MKQVVQNLRDGKTSVIEVPVPTPKPGLALVRTAASLVSPGTERMLVEFAEKNLLGKARSRPDLVRQVLDKAHREGVLTTVEAAFNRLDQPMPLGYSSAGTIVAIGEGLGESGFQVGQRVACAGGGYAVHAEFALVPHNLLAPLPDHVDFESAAFTTLGTISLQGFRLAGVQVGETIAVIGLGLLGLLAVGIATAAGCRVLGIDLDPWRAQLAVQFGAQATIRENAVESAQSYTHGRGCDAVLICADTSSNDPVELAGEIARDKARIVAVGAVGLDLPRKVYFSKELSFINSRSYGPGRYDPAYEEGGVDYPIGYVRWTEGRNMEAVVDLLASDRLDVRPLITHRFSIEHAPKAYELITGKREEPFIGVLLIYPLAEADAVETPAWTKVVSFETAGVAAGAGKIKLGVLGAGNFATGVLLPAMRKLADVELVTIASGSGLSASHAAHRFGFSQATADEAQVLKNPAINTVAILTRHHQHAAQVLAALAEGKHIFCEKPLALDSADLEEIAVRLSNTRQRDGGSRTASPSLMVGFNRRFAPFGKQLKEFFAGGSEPLVAFYRVNAGAIPLTHWVHDPAQGGGRIIGEGCHFVDFLTFLVGAPPVAVSAHGLPDEGRYREDNVVLTFTFPDGSVGTVIYLANGDKAFSKERVEVYSAGRIGVLDDFRSLELIKDGRRQLLRSRLRQDKGHHAELAAFVESILSGSPPPIRYDHLFGVTEATFAAVRALRSGEKTPIIPPLVSE